MKGQNMTQSAPSLKLESSGKTTSLIAAALLNYNGPCIIVDPKGQILSVPGKSRQNTAHAKGQSLSRIRH